MAGQTSPMRKVRASAFLALAATLVVGAAAAFAAPAKGKPVIVGFPTAATEFLSFYDAPIYEAAKIAAADINKKGGLLGRPIKLVRRDNQSKIPNVAARTQELLRRDKADFIVSSCDFDFGSPAVRAATKAGKLALGCASAPEYGRKGLGPLAFNTFQADVTESSSMAQFTKDKKWTKAFLFQDNTLEATKTVCETYETVFKKIGGTIVGKETFQGTDFSLAPQLASFRRSGADVIVLCSVLPGAGTAVKQIRAESQLPIVSQVALEGEFWVSCCPGLSNFYAIGMGSTAGDDPNPKRKAFFDKFQKATGERASVSISIMGYVTMELLAEGVKRAKSLEGAKVARALETLKNFPTVQGATTYTRTCHIPIGRPMVMVQIQNEKLSFAANVKPSFLPPSIC